MFDSLKAAGALAGLLKNKDAIREAGVRIKQRLADLRVGAASGGGAVSATVSGDMKVIEIRLEPALAASMNGPSAEQSRALAQSLIAEAVNNALDRAKELAQREIAKEAQALGLPDMPGLQGLLGG